MPVMASTASVSGRPCHADAASGDVSLGMF